MQAIVGAVNSTILEGKTSKATNGTYPSNLEEKIKDGKVKKKKTNRKNVDRTEDREANAGIENCTIGEETDDTRNALRNVNIETVVLIVEPERLAKIVRL